MERKKSNQASLLLFATLAALLSQNFVIPVISATTVEDQKNYYPPDPNAGTPPTGSSSHNPPYGHGGSHGGGHGGSHGGGHGSTPSHGTPSHGGGGYGGTPPANCGNPPSGGHTTPTPSTPSGGGGGYYHTPPTTPTPTTPSTPTPTPTPTTPSTPTPTPTTPSTPTPIENPPTIVSPPATPTVPSPPFAFDPNSPPFTCNYWRTHPTLIWAVLGWWGTVGGTLGATSVPGFGSNMSVLQALSNSHTDGFGALYREGTASFLNSMVNRDFPYTTTQVRDRFVGALSSNKAAANQAQLFKLANEGRLKLRA